MRNPERLYTDHQDEGYDDVDSDGVNTRSEISESIGTHLPASFLGELIEDHVRQGGMLHIPSLGIEITADNLGTDHNNDPSLDIVAESEYV